MNPGAALKFPEPATEPARPRSIAPDVRRLTENDLEAVADLFLRRFRPGPRRPGARAELAACLKAFYLDFPSRQGEADALVAVDSAGAVAAFCGAVRTRFQFDGRPASVNVTGTLMASDAPGHALAAMQIIKATRKLDYDLVVTDSANRASLAICQAMGYQLVSPDSLEWACVFEPAALALHKVRQRLGASWLGASGLRALGPLTQLADRPVAAVLRRAERAPKHSNWRDETVDAETFVDIAPRFLGQFRLRPDFTREEFLWQIEMARQRRSAGPLHLQVIYDGAGAPAGAYAAFGGKGEVARIFHAVAAPHAWGRLLDKMRETARARGCIAAHGPLKRPMVAHAYSLRGMFFYYAGGMLAYSRNPEVKRAIESGEAFLGGFAGDRWTRFASDSFG
jgi:hypothetical protein